MVILQEMFSLMRVTFLSSATYHKVSRVKREGIPTEIVFILAPEIIQVLDYDQQLSHMINKVFVLTILPRLIIRNKNL